MPRKRGDIWYARVQVKGRRAEVSLGRGATRADALQLESKYRKDSIAGRLGNAPKRTVEEALVQWLTTEASLLKSYHNLLSKVRAIEPYCSGIPLHEIVKVAETVKADGIKNGLTPATINRRLAILRRVANLAHDQWGWLDQNLGRRIKLLPGEARRDVYLTPDQAKHLADVCEHPRVADAIRLVSMSGLRETELLNLQPDHIRDGCIFIKVAKSGKPRIVPIPAEALAIPLPLGITYSTLRTYFEKARSAAGLDHVRFHDLRHTYASWFLQSGGNLVALRDLLGHSTIAITADLYSHLETSHLKKGVDQMGRMLKKQGKKKEVGTSLGQNSLKPA